MEYPVLILVHLFFGVLWAGGAITSGLFIVPAVIETGPAGGAVTAAMLKRRFALVMSACGVLVVVSGLRLYMVRFNAAWLTTSEGLVLTLGGLLGAGALAIGLMVQKPAAERMGALASQIAESGAQPTAAQAKELGMLRARLGRLGRVIALHLLGSTLLMAAHRLAATF